MSIVKFKDLQNGLDNDTLKLALKTMYNDAGFDRKVNSPKHLIIDWRGVNPDDVDLKRVDRDELNEYVDPQWINNPAVLKKMVKYVDVHDPDLLWIWLVDDSRFISDEHYQMNSEDENFNLLVKKTKFKLPLE